MVFGKTPVFSPEPLLKSLKSTQLSTLLSCLGLPTTGRKDDKIRIIQHAIQATRLGVADGKGAGNSTRRIVSIDMGIRNLAICAADVKFQRSFTNVNVASWNRIDVSTPTHSAGDDIAFITTDPYAPTNLSRTAYELVTSTILPLCSNLTPSTILIERQRYRTGGAQAVQEWTIRVNTLEAMIFSILFTLQSHHQNKTSPEIEFQSVSPNRVGRYWIPGVKTVEKSAKVDLVQTWMSGLQNFREIPVVLKSGIEATLGFQKGVGTAFERNKKKKDDLADSLLQLFAWAAWMAARRKVSAMEHDELHDFAKNLNSV